MASDTIMDIGPIFAAGTPKDIIKVKQNYTGQFLKPLLARTRRSQDHGGEAEATERVGRNSEAYSAVFLVRG